MNLAEVEQRVSLLEAGTGFHFIYDLLLAYGLPKASIARLQKGAHNLSNSRNELLWRGKVFFAYVDDGADLHALIDEKSKDERILKAHPRFLIVTDGRRLVAGDRRNNDTLDIAIEDLPQWSSFFLPWANIEKSQLATVNYADIKAAAKMARLYDEVVKANGLAVRDAVHRLNVFFSRLLFCFFAEDTGVFPKGVFTNAVASLTREDGDDLAPFLDSLFDVLNTPKGERSNLQTYFQSFDYVNGKLFDQPAPCPRFTAKARRILLECGTLDWSRINPDIFGSMIQVVVNPSAREGLGLHYTSVENIMKVIRPLFLDGLYSVFSVADSISKLGRLHNRICQLKIFDPACGSGNFLVIAYKELRKLEHLIIQRIVELDPNQVGLFKLSGIKLSHFYGIEIDDFAREVAVLSLWLAKHQMNLEFRDLFGVEIPLIPLRESGSIVCDNASRVDWFELCPPDHTTEIYICSNPPYRGAKLQSASNKGDFEYLFGTNKYPRNLDYVAIWFLKGADYVSRTGSELAFVTTNSVCQGHHVGLLWPPILKTGVTISFAHQSFPWTNQAKGNAGVTCIVVGLSARERKPRLLYSDKTVKSVDHINAYLRPSSRDTIVHARSHPIASVPPIREGNRPNDGGHLILSKAERDRLLAKEDGTSRYIKRYMGSKEFINGIERFCLWITDDEADAAVKIEELRSRLDAVRTARLRSGLSAKAVASTPHRFDHRVHQNGPSIIVPSVSSEHRPYIPIGILDGGTVVSNLAYVIYGAEPWLFGLLQSSLHMVWVDAVAGRLKTDYRYSGSLCYNTFPIPEMSAAEKEELASMAFNVIDAREQFPEKVLSDLYGATSMPNILRNAHEELDLSVDRLFSIDDPTSDDDRLETLFARYEVAANGRAGD